MTKIMSAAGRLHEQLKIQPWYRMTGITVGGDKEKLIVYTKVKKTKQTISMFEEFEVEYHYMGKIKLAGPS